LNIELNMIHIWDHLERNIVSKSFTYHLPKKTRHTRPCRSSMTGFLLEKEIVPGAKNSQEEEKMTGTENLF
jgi:hypothetical protein